MKTIFEQMTEYKPTDDVGLLLPPLVAKLNAEFPDAHLQVDPIHRIYGKRGHAVAQFGSVDETLDHLARYLISKMIDTDRGTCEHTRVVQYQELVSSMRSFRMSPLYRRESFDAFCSNRLWGDCVILKELRAPAKTAVSQGLWGVVQSFFGASKARPQPI